jgi:hypothetical protein
MRELAHKHSSMW